MGPWSWEQKQSKLKQYAYFGGHILYNSKDKFVLGVPLTVSTILWYDRG